jgi:folate-dependent phosphoribosylglycinamide formyltransferase PurN
MKITVFTSNQPRHLSLIAGLSNIADEVYAVKECLTIFPGKIDDFFGKSDVMQEYFSRVIEAEEKVFGEVRFSPPNVRSLAIKDEDLNSIDMNVLAPALDSDVYVVFGASFIKGPLMKFLAKKRAINIHMGVSPYYRGSSCNFWAIYDGNPDLVGATIHMLSDGLDSGDILFHTMPKPSPMTPAVLGMRAVLAAHTGLIQKVVSGEIFTMKPISQNKYLEIRYSRHKDFTDEVAKEFLSRNIGASEIAKMFADSPHRDLLKPLYV